jgi:hypothetical protein
MSSIVRLSDFRKPPPPSPQKRRQKRAKSQYELYPLPFFDAKRRCAWSVQPTGDYARDCEIGYDYALDFLKSCDGSIGWCSTFNSIVADMIRAGPTGCFADGTPKINGNVIGFVGLLGRALAGYVRLSNLNCERAAEPAGDE